ncbi:MAG: hypothetical protein LBE23_09940, partial [Vagococcus sp.]|nr:hypothetical protein [Vagococcus sp.]
MEHVIFDTNAYRYLVKGKSYKDIDGYLKKIKSKEKRNGISTFISPIVARELLAHLADKKDPSFDICLNATKAMYLHSSDEDGSQYNMIASPELLIAKMYFGTSIPRKEQTYQALIQIAYHLAKKPSKYNFTKFQKNLNDNRFDVLQTENVFAQSIFDFMKSQDPISSGWDFFKEEPEKRRKLLQIVRSDQFTIEIVSGLILSVYFLLQQER